MAASAASCASTGRPPSSPTGCAAREAGEAGAEQSRGGRALGHLAAVDGHGEPLAAGRATSRDRGDDGGVALLEDTRAALGAGDCAAQGVLVSLPGALQAGQARDLCVDPRLVEDQRVA